ncbi:hypothetical protein KAFR_0J01730 [Kazachstania africana CBS 2517]|uniref:Uncharacterized protein n=1 Tax=Kazachstania africana (strain ATCC 22294 / BCRC 22015 / CBS 2517 / CECT 1963 / NBRC 1671 / NRRL Y-8276) TaxID=1071382 RepID=H2B0T7_KAZAF|nr:hypothetical protein KAFR_0J01730 [Kazachstania africana CBS 2517]CCF60237.1 hypothetical protein KAFR_0J01730 [Kazachstania africana CBS 2517]
MNLNGLKNVTIWTTFKNTTVSQLICDFLKEENTILHYIDAVNSFPLMEFQNLVPANEDNKRVYDNIIITTSLNMQELYNIVKKIIENTEKIRLIVINGLDIMFRNSSFNDSSQAHELLKMVFLRVRGSYSGGKLKTLVLNRTGSVPVPKRKKLKTESSNGIYEFTSKYYADIEL